jgi:hypothetical protein
MGWVTSFTLRLVFSLNKKMGGPQRRCDCWGEENHHFHCSKLNAVSPTGKTFVDVKRTCKKIPGYSNVINQLPLIWKTGHFLLNPIGHLYVCSIIQSKIPTFKTNWPILVKAGMNIIWRESSLDYVNSVLRVRKQKLHEQANCPCFARRRLSERWYWRLICTSQTSTLKMTAYIFFRNANKFIPDSAE